MALRGIQRSGSNRLFAGGLAATCLIHGAIVALVLVARARAGQVSAGPVLGQVIEVEAVKFGKPRDTKFLPHKKAPPPPQEPKVVKLTDDEQAKPAPKPPPEPPKELPRLDPLLQTHARQFEHLADPENTGSAVEEGDPEGLRGGTATEGKGPIYLQHLVARVQNAWVVPTTISDEQLAKLKAQACMKIDATGKIGNLTISASSGNATFDSTLLTALGSIGRFEPPSDDLKETLANEGICLNFKKER